MTRPVNIAMIGLGWWGGRLAESGAKAGLNVKRCYERSASSRDRVAATYSAVSSDSYTGILATPVVAGVLLAAPHSTHADQIVEANLSYSKSLDPIGGRRSDPAESPASGMTRLDAHLADNVHYRVKPVARLEATSKQIVSVSSLDDVTSALLEFESGLVDNLVTSMVVPNDARTAVFGAGVAACSENDDVIFGTRLQDDKVATITPYPQDALNPVTDHLAEFLTCVQNGSRPETISEEGLEAVAVLETVVENMATKAFVSLSDTRAPRA